MPRQDALLRRWNANGNTENSLRSLENLLGRTPVFSAHRTVTADVAFLDSDDVLLVDTTAGDVTLTLPPAAKNIGRRFTGKKLVAANTMTLTSSGGLIDNALFQSATDAFTTITVQSVGDSWVIVPVGGSVLGAGFERGDIRAHGAVDGADNTTAILAAMAGGYGTVIFPPDFASLVAGTIAVPNNTRVLATGSTITQTTDDVATLYAVDPVNISIEGGHWLGVNSTTTFTDTLMGLFYFATSGYTGTSLRVTDVEIERCWNGIIAVGVTRVWIQNNHVHDFKFMGVCTSASNDFSICFNVIEDCSNSAAVNAYAIQATGDTLGGHRQSRGRIIGNTLKNIPAWDGMMTHDCTDLVVAFNQIENVRTGLDLGVFDANNIVESLVVIGNSITLTTTDTWAGAAANTAGIVVQGDAASLVLRAVVADNLIRGWGALPNTALGSGNPGSIVLAHVVDAAVTGNVVADVGSCTGLGRTGLLLAGTIQRVLLNGNMLAGDMESGGILVTNATITELAISDNLIHQTDTVDSAIVLLTSTVSFFSEGLTTTNSLNPFSESASSYTRAPMRTGDVETVGDVSVTGGVFGPTIALRDGGAGNADVQILTTGGFFRVMNAAFSAALLVVDEATGTMTTQTSATGGAGIRLPHGAAPSAPVDGDLWTTTAGLFIRINGATVGPLS